MFRFAHERVEARAGSPVVWAADLDAVPWIVDVAPNDWYRLVPIAALEQAQLALSVTERDDERVLPGTYSVDLKRIMPADVIAQSGDIFLSERLAQALIRSGGTGFCAEWEPHATANAVSGYRILRVTNAGWLGPIAEHQAVEPFGFVPPAATAQSLRRIPLTPVLLEGESWSGETVCWSPWVGIGRADFRLLLVRGDVLLRVVGSVPDLCCGLERVVVGDLPSKHGEAASIAGTPPTVPTPASLEATGAFLAGGASEFGHRFGAPAAAADVAWLSARAPFPLPAEYLELLRRWNGVDCFRLDLDAGGARADDEPAGALRIWAIGAHAELQQRQEESRDYGYSAWTEDWFPFGETVEQDILWMSDRHGRVRGAGKDGVQYGPDSSFAQWLADQAADLAYAWPRAIAGERWARGLYLGLV